MSPRIIPTAPFLHRSELEDREIAARLHHLDHLEDDSYLGDATGRQWLVILLVGAACWAVVWGGLYAALRWLA